MPRVASSASACLCPSGNALQGWRSAQPPVIAPGVAINRYNDFIGDFPTSRRAQRGSLYGVAGRRCLRPVPGVGGYLAKAKESQDRSDNDDQAYDVDDGIHGPLQETWRWNETRRNDTVSHRDGVVVVVVTAGPTGVATVVVCCVVVAGLGCSTRSDRTEQADVAASRKIKRDTRMTEASFKGHAGTAKPRRRCSGKRLKGSPLRWLQRDNV
jgi:hypothetical protein